MSLARHTAAALAVMAFAVQAHAQEQPTAEQAMARLIHAALAPSSYGDWRYRWDAVSIRISSMMHWHIFGPDKPGEEAITRRGWISVPGEQIGVSAHGRGETVASLAFELKSWRKPDGDGAGLLSALAAEGVTATETERRDPPELFHTDTPVIVYRLSAPERDERTLTRTVSCTSPMSAAAPRCSVSYELSLGG